MCSLKKTLRGDLSCIGKTADYKKIDDSIHKHHYDKMHQRMQSSYAERMMRLRSSTVEPVLGTLINFTGMRRIYTRGIKNANKFMICAGIAYNLKKYIRFISRKRISVCSALKKQRLLTKPSGLLTILVPQHVIPPYCTNYFFNLYTAP